MTAGGRPEERGGGGAWTPTNPIGSARRAATDDRTDDSPTPADDRVVPGPAVHDRPGTLPPGARVAPGRGRARQHGEPRPRRGREPQHGKPVFLGSPDLPGRHAQDPRRAAPEVRGRGRTRPRGPDRLTPVRPRVDPWSDSRGTRRPRMPTTIA